MNNTLPIGRDSNAPRYTEPAAPEFTPPPAPAPAAGPPEPVTPNEKALAAVTHKIGSTDACALQLFNSYRALKDLHAKYSVKAVESIKWQAASVTQIGHLATANKLDFMFSLEWGQELARMAQLDAGIKALEADPALPAAIELLDGLHAEKSRLESAVAADREAKSQAFQDVLDAQAAAIERARAAAETDPDLAAARERLAALDAPAPAPDKPLVRGKVKLAADPLQGDLH